MRVAYYCQHVLGIGHFHRSLEICRAIAQHSPTTLILGGPRVDFDPAGLQQLNLPGLKMDETFNNLQPCDPSSSLEQTKNRRRELLYSYFAKEKPEVFITELYPFGRKAFRFELDPILASITDNSLSPCRVFSSVRDILVEKTEGRKKFEQRVVDTLNEYFDGVLIHSDDRLITLDQTFGQMADIHIPLHSTGFVSRRLPRDPKGIERIESIREKLGLTDTSLLIVASIGGGNVGAKLLHSTISACRLLNESLASPQSYHLQLFCGPYFPEQEYRQVLESASSTVTVERFSDHFPEWLEAADLSISMAGYNTSMNLAQTGIPALVYPFAQNKEQQLRAEKLSKSLPLLLLEEDDLQPVTLAEKIRLQSSLERKKSAINLNGAKATAQFLTTL